MEKSIVAFDSQPEKIANAFLILKSQRNHSWSEISKSLKNTHKPYRFGTSPATLQGYFGIGGENRSTLKRFKECLPPKHARIQIEIIKEINALFGLGIKFSVDGNPLLNSQGNLVLHRERKSKPKIKLNYPLKDEYEMYYWRHDDKLGKAELILHTIESKKASLEIIYSHKDKNIYLEGSHSSLKGLITIRLHDLLQKDVHPYTQIIFLKHPDLAKDCYFATYSTSHRGANMLPVAGPMLLFRKAFVNENTTPSIIKGLATYILYKQRYKVNDSGFDLKITDKHFESENMLVNNYFEILKYKGIYEGKFINPKKKTFETCIVKIDESGEAEIWVDSNISYKPYKGIARIFNNNKVLSISYDYRPELNDYRMKLQFDISRYHLEYKSFVYGLMSGLEFSSEEPMATDMSLKIINHTPTWLAKYAQNVKALHLDTKSAFRAFVTELKSAGLYNFFFKEDNYSSVGLINKLTNKFK